MDFEERQTMRRRKVAFSAYLPISLVDIIDRIADSEGRTATAVVERLLRIGLGVEREARAKQATGGA
jgi:hypothetical protein